MLNVVPINNLDSDFLMGRRVFEILRTLTDHGQDLYHLRWNGRWVVIDVGSGICQYQLKLMGPEVKDWDLSRPSVLTKLRNATIEDSLSVNSNPDLTEQRQTRSMTKKLQLSLNGQEIIRR